MEAGRDENGQAAAGRDRAGRQFNGVVVSFHLRVRDAAHKAAGSGGGAAYRTEDGADDCSRFCKASVLLAGERLEAVVQVIAYACFHCQ